MLDHQLCGAFLCANFEGVAGEAPLTVAGSVQAAAAAAAAAVVVVVVVVF